MPTELLENIKQQAAALTFSEKAELTAFLHEQGRKTQTTQTVIEDAELVEKELIRQKRQSWLKTHWDEYRGLYLALDEDRLVGQGRTIREAHEQAKQKGVRKPFLVRIPRENEAFYAGW